MRGAYDLERMAFCRVVCIGTGGGASFIEDLARAGVGEFVLIDPDSVSETNLATQQTYRRDLGRPKVDCLAERLRDINASARVATYPQSLGDFDDGAFDDLLAPLWRESAADDAAVRSHRSVRRPCGESAGASIWGGAVNAQVYKEGRGAEVTFTFPGVTPACNRCVLASRYDVYLDEGFENDVTSPTVPPSSPPSG